MATDAAEHVRAILHRRANDELDAVLDHLRARFRADATGLRALAAAALEKTVFAALHMIELKPRFQEDLDHLLDLAMRVHKGEDAATLADEHVERALRLNQLKLIARVHDPAFRHIVRTARDTLAARLPDLARMAAVEHAENYEEIVRRAFPDRRHVEALIDENHALTTRIIGHLEANPQVVRFTRGLVPRLTAIAHELIDWETERVRSSLDAIYDFDPPV